MHGGMMEDQIKSMMSEFSSALADMVVAMQEKKAGTDEISATLADIVTAIEANKSQPLNEIVTAIKAIRLEAPINVGPTPIQNIVQPAPVQILEREQPSSYKLTGVKYDNFDRVIEALIEPVASNSIEAE